MSDRRPVGLAAVGAPGGDHRLTEAVLDDPRVDARRFDDVDAALADPATEVIWMPGDVGGAIAAVRAGRPVLLDPPPAASAAGIAGLAAATAEAGVHVAVAHRRGSPQVERARVALADGSLGLPWALQLHYTTSEAGDPESLIARLTFEAVDAIACLTGLTATSIHAAGETILTISLELERGVLATVVAGSVPTDDPTVGGLRRILVAGSQGILLVEEDRPLLDVRSRRRPDASRAGEGGARPAIARALVADIVGLRAGRPGAVDLADARPTLAVVAAARASAAGAGVLTVDAAAVAAGR